MGLRKLHWHVFEHLMGGSIKYCNVIYNIFLYTIFFNNKNVECIKMLIQKLFLLFFLSFTCKLKEIMELFGSYRSKKCKCVTTLNIALL